jgi:hypothetical protein
MSGEKGETEFKRKTKEYFQRKNSFFENRIVQ